MSLKILRAINIKQLKEGYLEIARKPIRGEISELRNANAVGALEAIQHIERISKNKVSLHELMGEN